MVFLFPSEYILLHPRSLALSFPLLLLFELCLYLPNRLLLSSLALLLLLSLSLSLSLLLRALHKQPSIYAEICISTSTPSFAIEVSLQVIELGTTYSTPGYRHRESILLYHTYTSINILSTTDQASHRPQPNTYNRNQVDPATHTSLHRPTNT